MLESAESDDMEDSIDMQCDSLIDSFFLLVSLLHAKECRERGHEGSV